MVAVYITSMEAAGKTALCAGIGRKLLDRGVKVGFIVPVQIFEVSSANGNEDVAFIKETFDLKESDEQLSPIRLSQTELWQSLTAEVTDFTSKLKQVYRKISRSRDVVIMEGLGNLGVDKVSDLACYTIAEALEAMVIIVLRYAPTLDVSKVAHIGEKLGQPLGVVINLVPESKIEEVRLELPPLFDKAGVKILGILPEVRSLLGVSVGELAGILDGEILTSMENADEMVESVMVGAMTPDPGATYFNRKENKAVVVRGDRADMQLAALETSTKCLILTSNLKPLPAVVSQAQDKHVPIIVVKQDNSETIAGIEEALVKASFHNHRKLDIFGSVLDRYFDFGALCSELGLKA
ncbi:MAG: phosphotransacetylase family protein [Chloroflexota bacterium]|nr:MAG: phosphotransacetylase family protein [Chloroflexota bacterium]